MFDTHCHLNFSRLQERIEQVVAEAETAEVTHIVVPGTDVTTSQKAVEIAGTYAHIYAAVGIHPHHVFEFGQRSTVDSQQSVDRSLSSIEQLLTNDKVVAVGEIGMDKHSYGKTRHEDYAVTEEFVKTQKLFLGRQIELAVNYKKSIIFHNREAKEDLLPIVSKLWDEGLCGRTVFHCCEPDKEILKFAKEHKIFIGVDGDITYMPAKQEFIREVPLEMLVLETDAPFLLPEPLRTQKKFPNEPKNLSLINGSIAQLLSIEPGELAKILFKNSMRLFAL